MTTTATRKPTTAQARYLIAGLEREGHDAGWVFQPYGPTRRVHAAVLDAGWIEQNGRITDAGREVVAHLVAARAKAREAIAEIKRETDAEVAAAAKPADQQPAAAVTITIERSQLYPAGGGNYRSAWRWTYDYRVDGGPVAQYGTGLASLRSMLKSRFPGARIVETWKTPAAPAAPVVEQDQADEQPAAKPAPAVDEQAAAEAAKHREAATHYEREAYDSFERCDTDGFLSQWANGILAHEHRLQAQIIEAGNRWDFPALFDLEGNLVAAKLVDTKYGTAWGILTSDDPHSRITRWITAFPARKTTMERKGYREGTVKAPAKADIGGGSITSVRAIPVRTDGGFSRDVEIVNDGRGE